MRFSMEHAGINHVNMNEESEEGEREKKKKRKSPRFYPEIPERLLQQRYLHRTRPIFVILTFFTPRLLHLSSTLPISAQSASCIFFFFRTRMREREKTNGLEDHEWKEIPKTYAL